MSQNSYHLNDLADLNRKIAMDSLDDAVEYLRECRERLDKAMEDLRELKERLE